MDGWRNPFDQERFVQEKKRETNGWMDGWIDEPIRSGRICTREKTEINGWMDEFMSPESVQSGTICTTKKTKQIDGWMD